MSKHKPKEEEQNFQIRPPFSKKFKPGAVKVRIGVERELFHSSRQLQTENSVCCQEIIHGCLNEQLGGKVYDANKVSQWSKAIADNVKSQVKTLGYDRYKIVVEVVIGEQRGEGGIQNIFNKIFSKIFSLIIISCQGVRMGSRCLWDSDTDNYASDVYMNDSLFCCTAVFGLYYY